MSENQWCKQEAISARINELLVMAIKIGDPACAEAQKMCELHKEWLMMFWSDGTYSKQAHMILGESYVSDERFKAYYEKMAVGGAEFMRDALLIYCK